MMHSPEELEHFSANQPENDQEKKVYHPRPVWHSVLAWLLIAIVLFAFLGTCYWLAFYGRGTV